MFFGTPNSLRPDRLTGRGEAIHAALCDFPEQEKQIHQINLINVYWRNYDYLFLKFKGTMPDAFRLPVKFPLVRPYNRPIVRLIITLNGWQMGHSAFKQTVLIKSLKFDRQYASNILFIMLL